MRGSLLIPAVAEFPKDLATSLELVSEADQIGYEGGLMIVVRKGVEGLTEEKIQQQRRNLDEALSPRQRSRPIVVMLSNIPIEQMDWLHHSADAEQHVLRGIEFTSRIPTTGRKVLTFHLNSLVTIDEFNERSGEEWAELFDTIAGPALQRISATATKAGVEVKIETVPVPEFGDSAESNAALTYRGTPLHEMRNPWYLSHIWGFDEVRDRGLGICLDLCHNRTLYDQARQASPEGLFPENIEFLKTATVLTDVKALEDSDLVHLNDGRGTYSADGGRFDEGVALGQGDIVDLPEIVKILSERNILTVLEAEEGGDFVNRPGSRKSLDWLRSH